MCLLGTRTDRILCRLWVVAPIKVQFRGCMWVLLRTGFPTVCSGTSAVFSFNLVVDICFLFTHEMSDDSRGVSLSSCLSLSSSRHSFDCLSYPMHSQCIRGLNHVHRSVCLTVVTSMWKVHSNSDAVCFWAAVALQYQIKEAPPALKVNLMQCSVIQQLNTWQVISMCCCCVSLLCDWD